MKDFYRDDPAKDKNPHGAAVALRRDVIAVLDGASAESLHERWRCRQFLKVGSGQWATAVRYNPTLLIWANLPKFDKEGFRLFERTVRNAYVDGKFQQEEVNKRCFAIAEVPRTVSVPEVTATYVPKAPPVVDPQHDKIAHCSKAGVAVVNAYRSALGKVVYAQNEAGWGNVDDCTRAVLNGGDAVDVHMVLKAKLSSMVTSRVNWDQLSEKQKILFQIFTMTVRGAAEQFETNKKTTSLKPVSFLGGLQVIYY